MKRITIILLVSFVLSISAFLILFFFNKKPLPKYGESDHKTGQFSFYNQNGKLITEKEVVNKIRVVEFFFTTCKSICPKINANMQKVYNKILDDPGIIIMSHTVDPTTDNVAKLKRYSDSLGVNSSKWLFLTGDKKHLYDAARFQYLVSAGEFSDVPIEEDFIHTEKFVLIDKNNYIRGFYDGTDDKEIKRLIEDIKQLK